MWREYGADGYLVYSFAESVAAMHPMYLIRAAGGAMYLAGFLLLVFNVWATLAGKVREAKPMTETPYNAAADRPLAPVPADYGASGTWLHNLPKTPSKRKSGGKGTRVAIR